MPAPARVLDRPVEAWKRAQVLVDPSAGAARFAGPVHPERPYRADEVFWCAAGHRRLEPSCTCGFYAVAERAALRPSVVTTSVLRVALEGRVVVHRDCLRAERQVVRAVAVEPWCTRCVAPAVALGGVPSLWGDLPAPWLRAVPLCDRHAGQAPVALVPPVLAALLGADLGWDDGVESRVARSLRRLRTGGAGGAQPVGSAPGGQPSSPGSSGRAQTS